MDQVRNGGPEKECVGKAGENGYFARKNAKYIYIRVSIRIYICVSVHTYSFIIYIHILYINIYFTYILYSVYNIYIIEYIYSVLFFLISILFYLSIYQSRTFSSKEAAWAVSCLQASSGMAPCLTFLSRLHSETPFFVKPFLVSLPGKKFIICFVVCGALFPYAHFYQYPGLISAHSIYFPTRPLLFNCESSEKGIVSYLVLTPRAWHIIET